MGVVIPQIVTSDRATGAQVIDGSLKFDSSKSTKLSRTPGSAGNRRTWTWSGWVKRTPGAYDFLLDAQATSVLKCTIAFWSTNDYIRFKGDYNDGTARNFSVITSALFRDTGWYHVVTSLDTTQSTDTDRIKIYVNGVLQELTSATYPTQNSEIECNNTSEHLIGSQIDSAANGLDGALTNVTFVDGQALDASYFGFTDPLTNTWKPKKYEGTFGTNGFYLPMDGSAPIGQDQSGQGNNWTPVNFGGSVALDNPIVSGARPILNTLPGGAQAGVGVFGSKQNVGYAVTVYDDGGGNKYYIDGVKQATLTGLIRGATYTFDTSDSTVSSHPFRFSATSNGSHGGGTEYTNGVAAITGAATTITVPYNAPETLYYYCTSHSGMGADITGITTNEKLADQYASHCTLALPLVGADDDVCASIACTSSLKSGTLTTASIVTTNSNFYSGSLNMGGGYYDITDSTEFNFGSGSYTVECWVYVTSGGTAGSAFIGKWYAGSQGTTNSYLLYRNTSGELHWIVSADGTNGTSYNAGAIPLNKWTHCAVSYDSSSDILTTFIDGVCVKRVSSPASPATVSRSLTLGRWDIGDGTWSGQMSDVRIYKGVAKYTASAEGNQGFVPASTNPDILPDTPSGVSGSSKFTKITDGAVHFDGGDSTNLSIADSTDFDHASAFTWEGYFYLKSYDSSGSAIVRHENDGLDWYVNTSGNIVFNQNTSTGLVSSGNGVMTLNKWVHIAISHTGSVCKLFVDGIEKGSATTSAVPDNVSGILYIGETGDNNNYQWNGFISNLRFVNGTALYTSRFTPPTAPLTDVTNTKLLCCQSTTPFITGAQPILNTNSTGTTTTSGTRGDASASSIVLAIPMNGSNGGTTFTDYHHTIKGSGSAKTITANGDVQTSTAQSKFYGSSGAFDGTSDYLDLAASSDFAFGTGDFTVECFIYSGVNSVDTFYRRIYMTDGPTGNATGNFQIAITPTSGVINLWETSGQLDVSGTTNVTNLRWNHIAAVRSGTTLKLYVNGIEEVSTTYSTSVTANSGSPRPRIGNYNGSSGNGDFDGYMQDLRVYKGVAKYTSNFTVTAPSVEPTAAVSPSSLLGLGNAAATNFNPFNTDINTVRGQETGYAIMNPLDKHPTSATEDGNLVVSNTSNLWCGIRGTFGRTSGKFYYEVKTGGAGTGGESVFIGLGSDNPLLVTTNTPQNDNTTMAAGTVLYCDDGQKILDSSTRSSYGTAISNQDLIGVAYDLDNKTIEFFNNGTSQGSIDFSSTVCGGANQIVFPYYISYYNSTKSQFNFGQKPFKFPPPDGFQPLNNANVRPETVISRPDQYVGIVTYTGDSTDNRQIRVGMQPDLVWTKRRDTALDHHMWDSVRGAAYELYSNQNYEQGGPVSPLRFAGFNYDGFTVNNHSVINQTGNWVAWCWKAGGNKNTFNVDNVGYSTYTTAPGLDAGALKISGASVGTKQGFSIIKYVGNATQPTTVPHGLNSALDFMIIKNLTTANNWAVFHKGLIDGGTVRYLRLNTTDEQVTGSGHFGNTAPTDTVFTLGSDDQVNKSGDNFIAYCWHDVPGLQKFGSYAGSSSTTFVELGFRPALLVIKFYDGTDVGSHAGWKVIDNQRNKFNISGIMQKVAWDVDEDENGGTTISTSEGKVDFLSNGFRVIDNHAPFNTSGRNYIYAAWAEAPSIDLYGGGANAR